LSKDPAFLFYSQDFIVGVQTMTWEDRGKYITILAQMHQQGRMSEETICFLVGSVSLNLKSKFKVDDQGLWYNDRLEEEISKRSKYVESRRINGKAGGRPKAYVKPYGLPTGNHSEDENEVVNEIGSGVEKRRIYNEKFDIFWGAYPKRNGKKVGKQAAQRKFEKIPVADLDRVIANARNYGINNDYPKDPERFLKDDFWKDWETPQQPKQIGQKYGRQEVSNEALKRMMEVELE